MKRSRLLAGLGATVLSATLAASQASAQGTNAPAPLPPLPEAAGETPSQPPAPAAAGPAEPAEPGGAVDPAPAGAAPRAPIEEEGAATEGGRPPPPARRGFQVAVRGGVAVPFGSAAKDTGLADVFGGQFAAIIDIGGKIIPELFLGAYLGANVGAVGDQTSQTCEAINASCIGATYRIGAQLQYHILPAGKVDPWIGYGVGYEVSRTAGSGGGRTISQTLAGPEYAHIMGGIDFRLTKVFGVGPFIDLSLAQYSNQSVEVGGRTIDGEIRDKALHQWLTIGAKFLFFP